MEDRKPGGSTRVKEILKVRSDSAGGRTGQDKVISNDGLPFQRSHMTGRPEGKELYVYLCCM